MCESAFVRSVQGWHLLLVLLFIQCLTNKGQQVVAFPFRQRTLMLMFEINNLYIHNQTEYALDLNTSAKETHLLAAHQPDVEHQQDSFQNQNWGKTTYIDWRNQNT